MFFLSSCIRAVGVAIMLCAVLLVGVCMLCKMAMFSDSRMGGVPVKPNLRFLQSGPTTGSCSGAWQQCGGNNWGGPYCCLEGFSCEFQHEWYSQCAPVPEPSNTTTTTSEAGLLACMLPDGTSNFSLITHGDATIHAHEVYSGIIVGGRLLDGSPEEHGNIGGYCPECPAIVTGDCPDAACGSDGTFNFLGKPLLLGTSSPFVWSDFEELARTARAGEYPGVDGCDMFRVHVSHTGGEFAMSDFCIKAHGCDPEDNGCTLVIFNTKQHIILSQGRLGRQFGPSVIAPFSGVTLLDTAGYIDGILVAKWFGGYIHQQVGEDGGSLQMHGKVYKGPIFCKSPLTTNTTTTNTTTTTNAATTTANITFTSRSSNTSTTTSTVTSSTTTTTNTTTATTTGLTSTNSTTSLASISSTTTMTSTTTSSDITTTTTDTPATTTSTTSTSSTSTSSTTSTTSATSVPMSTTTSTTGTTSTTAIDCKRKRLTTIASTTSSGTNEELLGAQAYCTVWGDPHILPFDYPADGTKNRKNWRGSVGIFSSGDFWLVRSQYVHIQARYWSVRRNRQSSARAVAIGGPFLQGSTLIVEQEVDGNVYWNGREILYTFPSEFTLEGLVHAWMNRTGSGLWRGRKQRTPVVDIELPLGVKLAVIRLRHRIDVKITMHQLPGGQDGHCGNFNGIESDDDTASIKSRFRSQIPGESLLFQKKEYKFVGCFADLKNDRDLPVKKAEAHLDIVGCSTRCSGYKYFARQSNGKCFCGNSYGKHGAARGCSCGAANVGYSRNCVYANLDATNVDQQETLVDCPADRRELGHQKCDDMFRSAKHSQAFIDACVYDFCFGGSEFVSEDANAAELLD